MWCFNFYPNREREERRENKTRETKEDVKNEAYNLDGQKKMLYPITN